jgi:hypothetical protein
MRYGEIKALFLACNGIAFRGQTQCFFRTIALLLQGVQKGAEIERVEKVIEKNRKNGERDWNW